MGWPELPASLELLSDSWDNAPVPFEQAQTDINSAWSYWQGANDHSAIQYTLYALQHLHDAVDYMLCYVYMFSPKTCLCAVLHQMRDEYVAGAAEVNMDSILNAMIAADPNEVEYFVGLLDAYRQSIWNRPFNKEFFAALGRGFMQWE